MSDVALGRFSLPSLPRATPIAISSVATLAS